MSGQSCRVYVGNLDWKVSWQELKDHMRQAGEVLFADIFEEYSGRSKGVAIVEYKTPEDAKAAIEKLHDTTLGSRMIFVREDREASRSKGSGSKGDWWGGKGWGKGAYGYGYGKGWGGTPLRVGPKDKGRLVYVGNLPYRAAWQDLKDVFKKHGEVIRVDVAHDMEGYSKGYATVLFEKEEDATAAIEALNETDFQGRNMMVRLDTYV
eukprot:gb/GFBE01046432.1/.p1 GENE.gb/GFBE01046432.1/~~gb/GFBE01046432.1/.p1  ORF type:complete len:208 (+),score=54.76 gb/GFBE01046432.1/:1-624(+)